MQAEPLFQRALAIKEQVLGSNHPDTAITLDNLTGLYESMSRYKQAEALYQHTQRTEKMREK
jgi:hypothetical protein